MNKEKKSAGYFDKNRQKPIFTGDIYKEEGAMLPYHRVEEKIDEYIEPPKPKTTTPAKTYSWHEMYKMNNKKKEPQFCDICGCELITEREKAQGLCEDCYYWGWA